MSIPSTSFVAKAIPILLGLGIAAGCSQSTAPGSANNSNGNQVAANRVENSVVAPVSSPSASSNTLPANAGQAPNSSPAKQPTPFIGSGGDDLSLFTKVRGAMSSDAELARSVIVEIKEGVVTLSGNVSSPAQKAKAEDLVKKVAGVKSVKNNLRTAS